jgi:hypothetical protein
MKSECRPTLEPTSTKTPPLAHVDEDSALAGSTLHDPLHELEDADLVVTEEEDVPVDPVPQVAAVLQPEEVDDVLAVWHLAVRAQSLYQAPPRRNRHGCTSTDPTRDRLSHVCSYVPGEVEGGRRSRGDAGSGVQFRPPM